MNMMQEIVKKKANVLFVLGLALMWGFGVPLVATAQDSHAGHDHSAHADDEGGDAEHDDHADEGHAEEDHDDQGEELGVEDDHSGHDHGEKDEHGDAAEAHEDGETGHEGHSDEEQVVKLNAADLEEFDIEIRTAGAGNLDQFIELPGEIVLNADRLAHVPPTLPGIVQKVFKHLGDHVETGEVLAVISSRELADARAGYLAARERLALAKTNAEREATLRQKQISAESEYLEAQSALAEAVITHSSTEQKLYTLGFSESDLREMPQSPGDSLTVYEIKAPFSGTIIEKHITLGENLDVDTSAFTIADLSDVWVDVSVYQKDLSRIRKQQGVLIRVGHGMPDITAKILWVSPIVNEATRTANARVVLNNSSGDLRPGMFITANVAVSSTPVGVMIPKTALQTVDGRTVVFARTNKGFEPQAIEVGERNATHVEIVSGLLVGQSYVSQGAFTLKAQLSKGAFGDGHNH